MEEMDLMGEDDQVGGVHLPIEAPLSPANLSTELTTSWPFPDGFLPIPPASLAEAMAAASSVAVGNEYTYTFDFTNLNLSQSGIASLEQVLDDDQPSVTDYNRVQDVCEFIDKWALWFTNAGAAPVVAEASRTRLWERPTVVRAGELQGDRYDVQGIDWTRLQTTRDEARKARAMFFQKHNTKYPFHGQTQTLPAPESYYRFRQMNAKVRPYISHFQLRNLITATSQTDTYYAGRFQVVHTDGHRTRTVMDLSPSSATWHQSRHLQITCLASSEDLLVVGGFSGEYALTHLGSDMASQAAHGILTHEANGITNHVHTFNHRHASHTQAAFCSNDSMLRILDCSTNSITDSFEFPFAINCSATSPDGRLRMVVGDSSGAILTNAETGQTLERMCHHGDDIFACAWADDGIHVATGAQDSRVVIYDARRWDRPLSILSTEISCARSLRFSPVGSGKRLLFVAEASDYVHVVDAQTFKTCQKLDFFGAIGGLALTPDGSALHVANCDPKFGGLLQYEQASAYGRNAFEDFRGDFRRRRRGINEVPAEPLDWYEDRDLESKAHFNSTWEHRFRKDLGLHDLMI